MHSPRPRLRRARRTDFVAVLRLLGAGGAPLPPPDRATVRRFRRIVADLGADLYVSVNAGVVAGVIHVTYARRLTTGPRARVETLAVEAGPEASRLRDDLLALAVRRARKHDCSAICWDLATDDSRPRRDLLERGWKRVGECLQLELAPSTEPCLDDKKAQVS